MKHLWPHHELVHHISLQIFEFQFSKSLILFLEGGQESIIHSSKKYFRPLKNDSLSPFNKKKTQRLGELENEYLEIKEKNKA